MTLTISGTPLNPEVGIPYSFTPDIEGAQGDVTFSGVSDLTPYGISFDTSTGVFSGTPTKASSPLTLTFTASDSASTAVFSAPITINGRLALVGNPPNGSIGVPYSFTFTTTGGSGSTVVYTTDTNKLPPGITLNAMTGVLSGKSTKVGSYPLIINASDGSTETQFSFDLVITPTISLSGTPYTVLLNREFTFKPTITGGLGPQSWSIVSGVLPNGLSLDPDNLSIDGLVSNRSQIKSFNATLSITDLSGTATLPMTFNVVDIGKDAVVPTNSNDSAIAVATAQWLKIANVYSVASPTQMQTALNLMVSIIQYTLDAPTTYALNNLWNLQVTYKDTVFTESNFFTQASSLSPATYRIVSSVYINYRAAIVYPNQTPTLASLLKDTGCGAMVLFLQSKY